MATVGVEVFVDPSCPWAWITSRWLAEVAPSRDLSLTWRSYCLEIRDDYGVAPTMPEEYRERALAGHALSHRMLRLFEAARAESGEGAVDALYTEWGRRYFLGDGDRRWRVGAGSGAMAGRSWPGASPGAASARTFLERRTTRSGTRRSSRPWRSPTSTEDPRPKHPRSWCGRRRRMGSRDRSWRRRRRVTPPSASGTPSPSLPKNPGSSRSPGPGPIHRGLLPSPESARRGRICRRGGSPGSAGPVGRGDSEVPL